MKSLFSIFVVLMLFTTVFYSMNIVGQEIHSNDNLDNESKVLISNINTNLNNDFQMDTSYNELQSNTSVNGTFDNADVYAQEYLEGKSQGDSKIGIIRTIWKMPDMIVMSLGVDQDSVTTFKAIIMTIVGVLFSFALYRMLFGGGKVTDN